MGKNEHNPSEVTDGLGVRQEVPVHDGINHMDDPCDNHHHMEDGDEPRVCHQCGFVTVYRAIPRMAEMADTP